MRPSEDDERRTRARRRRPSELAVAMQELVPLPTKVSRGTWLPHTFETSIVEGPLHVQQLNVVNYDARYAVSGGCYCCRHIAGISSRSATLLVQS